MNDRILNVDGIDRIVTDDGEWSTGLKLPVESKSAGRRLGDIMSPLSSGQIRSIIESQEFSFGEKLFDSTWTTNQNGYGSCASYGAASALSKAMWLRGAGRVDLSGDYLYSLVNGGRDRGSMLDENMEALMNRGVAKRETVPLGKIYRSRYDTRTADAEAKRFRGHELFEVRTEDEMATALALQMPVVVAIHVTRRWRQFDAENVLAECNGVGNHCEHCDDIKYSTRRGCFLYRKATSHGVSYNPSHGGYCWTLWADHYRQTIRHHKFYAVPAAIDDPQGTNPPSGRSRPQPEPQNEVSIVMESSEGCSHCVRWKRTEQAKCEAAGWTVRTAAPRGGPIPDFTLRVGPHSVSRLGFWPFESILEEVQRWTRS
jgi:hypothetical protein